jgi:prepilin-type processing-associated H-X9-DG protein
MFNACLWWRKFAVDLNIVVMAELTKSSQLVGSCSGVPVGNVISDTLTKPTAGEAHSCAAVIVARVPHQVLVAAANGGSNPPGSSRAWFSNGMLLPCSKIKPRHVTAGTFKTILIGESKHAVGQWAVSGKSGSTAVTKVPCGTCEQINYFGEYMDFLSWASYRMTSFSNLHRGGGANFVMADGSVHWLNEIIDLSTYRLLVQRNDGKPVNLGSL